MPGGPLWTRGGQYEYDATTGAARRKHLAQAQESGQLVELPPPMGRIAVAGIALGVVIGAVGAWLLRVIGIL